jgi:drug/metabolite transporter (DMT)-like permease
LRIGAAIFGFVGVLVMIRPGAGGQFAVGLPALAMLGSAFLFAFTVTGMKVLTRDHSTTVILVWSAVLGFVLSIPGAIVTWRVPEPKDFVLLCLMGVIATANQACYIKGMSLGDAGAMAPIDYTRLVFTASIGFLLFNEVPSVWTIAGAAIVVAATLFITIREQRLARSAKLSALRDGAG